MRAVLEVDRVVNSGGKSEERREWWEKRSGAGGQAMTSDGWEGMGGEKREVPLLGCQMMRGGREKARARA
jgi:hypothetical protein